MSIPTTNAAAMREFSRAALCDALRHAGASDEALREQVRDIMAGLGADGAVEAMAHVLRAYVDLYGRETGLKPPQIRWDPTEETAV